jgi:cytoskeleton protein RodZ
MLNDTLQSEMIDQDPTPVPPTAPGAAQVGAGLREVRERLGWKLADVSALLRIRLTYLEAIERGDLAALPGPAYQTGFVRSYAQLLGLDSEEILRRFRAEGLGRAAKAELTFLAPVPDRGVPTGAIALVGVVLVLIGYGIWYHNTANERRLATAVPSVPAELAPLALPPKPATPPKPIEAQAAPVAAPAPQAPAPAVAPTPSPAVVVTTPAPATPGVVAPPPPDTTVQGKAILATADSWIEVRDATGVILFSKVLHAGQSWPVPQEAGLTLTTGNAGGTEITQDGKPGAPLGAPGVVLHRYVLTSPAAPGAAPATH